MLNCGILTSFSIFYFHTILAGVEKCGCLDCLGVGEVTPALQERKTLNSTFGKENGFSYTQLYPQIMGWLSLLAFEIVVFETNSLSLDCGFL